VTAGLTKLKDRWTGEESPFLVWSNAPDFPDSPFGEAPKRTIKCQPRTHWSQETQDQKMKPNSRKPPSTALLNNRSCCDFLMSPSLYTTLAYPDRPQLRGME